MGNKFQAQDWSNQQENEKYPPEIFRLPKKQYTNNYRPYGSYSGPDGITGAHGYGLHRFIQEYKAHNGADKKTQYCTWGWKNCLTAEDRW